MVKKVLAPIKNMLFEYTELRDRAKNIKSRMDELAKKIKEYANDHGNKDKNGSFYSQTDDFVYGNQAKRSVSLNKDRAKEFFVSKGLYEKVVDVVEVINEEKIEQLVKDNVLSLADIEAISDIKVTYAIDIKAVQKEEKAEDMPVVEVTKAVKKVAKKK